MNEFVSIIIPTYREWYFLKTCVEALNNQSYNKESFEVLIVNNDTPESVPENFSLPYNFLIITETKPGSYAARNAALKIAKGNIIGFTDSDCIPDKDWIKNAVDYLNKTPSCSRVAGNIKIIEKSVKSSIVEKYNQLYAFPQQWLIDNGGGSITANLFTYKSVFEKIGAFDETLMSMGDKIWGIHAQKNGFQIHYVKDVIVFHPARNFKQLVIKEKRHGGAIKWTTNKNLVSLYMRFIYEFRPRISGLRFVFSKRKDISLIDRIIIPLLRHYLLIIRAHETLKIHLGKKPNRL